MPVRVCLYSSIAVGWAGWTKHRDLQVQPPPLPPSLPPSSTQNPLHASTEFYVQCAIKFMHERENFRQKPLKGNGRGRIREGKERGPPRPPGIPVLKVKNSPPLSVKIPENSCYENTAYTSPFPCLSLNLSQSSFIYQLLINPSPKKPFDSDLILLIEFPNA